MRVDLLHIAECPNWDAATDLLRRALNATGHSDIPINVTLIDSREAAERTGFAGSPTILVDGDDLFPSDARTPDLACRIYITPTGLAGTPTREQIEEALAAHG